MAGGLRRATVAFAGALTAQRGKVTGQLDVLAYREEWQQVELLEDVAGVVDAEMVAARGGQLFQVLAEQADAAAAGLLHAAEEAEQGGLAAAGRPLEEQALAAFEMEAGNVQQLRLAGPGEAEVGQGDQCAHGGRGGTLRRSLENGWRGAAPNPSRRLRNDPTASARRWPEPGRRLSGRRDRSVVPEFSGWRGSA